MSDFAELKQTLERVEARQDEMFKRLFIGNGVPPFSTRLDRLEQQASTHKWHVRTIWTAVVTVAVGGSVSLLALVVKLVLRQP